MPEDYALPTHSSEPSVNRWCFQTGTEALSSSIMAWQAWNASARCGQDTPTTTARSPTARSPDAVHRGERHHLGVLGDDGLGDAAQFGLR